MGGGQQQEHKAAGHFASTVGKPRETGGALLASSISPLVESGTSVCGIVLPTFKIGLVTLPKPLWKSPPK